MRRALATLVLILAGAVLALFGGQCARRHAEPLNLTYHEWPGYEPLYLAEQLHYLEPSSVRLIECTSATQSLRAFRNGATDAAALTLDETLALAEDVPDLRIVLVLDTSDGADALLGRPGIGSLAALRGRVVGYEAGAVGSLMLARALERAGLTPDAVQLVSLAVDEHEMAWDAGRVDAIVTFEPVRSRLVEKHARVLFDSAQIPNQIVDVLVVRKEYLDRHPDVVDDLVRGWFRSLSHLRANPEANRALARRMKLREGQVQEVYRRLVLPDLQRNLDLLGGATPGLGEPAASLADFLLRSGILTRSQDPSALFDAGPLHRVSESR